MTHVDKLPGQKQSVQLRKKDAPSEMQTYVLKTEEREQVKKPGMREIASELESIIDDYLNEHNMNNLYTETIKYKLPDQMVDSVREKFETWYNDACKPNPVKRLGFTKQHTLK